MDPSFCVPVQETMATCASMIWALSGTFSGPKVKQCSRVQTHMAKFSSPHRTEQLYSRSSLAMVPGPCCTHSHHAALSGRLFWFRLKPCNNISSHVTVALQDRLQSLSSPCLDYLYRCSLWNQCLEFLELHKGSENQNQITRSHVVQRGIVQIS